MEVIPVDLQTVRNMKIKYIENSLFNDSEGYDRNHCALKG
jgi:hypothetical protein